MPGRKSSQRSGKRARTVNFPPSVRSRRSRFAQKETETGVQLRYRAAFENETAEATFTLEKNGKIASLRLRPSED